MSALRPIGLAVAVLAGLAAPAWAQTPAAIERLGLPGPFVVRGVSYNFAWSSNPSASYFKQEYVPEGETPERFSGMVLVELVSEGVDPVAVAAAKIAELKARKAFDPTANFSVARNDRTGELLLDFVLSAEPAGAEPVSEWNAYRYAPYAGPGGAKGVTLFGFSRRAYGDARLAFFKALKAQRQTDITAFAALPAPKPALR